MTLLTITINYYYDTVLCWRWLGSLFSELNTLPLLKGRKTLERRISVTCVLLGRVHVDRSLL